MTTEINRRSVLGMGASSAALAVAPAAPGSTAPGPDLVLINAAFRDGQDRDGVTGFHGGPAEFGHRRYAG